MTTNYGARPGLAVEPRTVSCGCCAGGCVCVHHQDAPRGLPVHVCDYHREHGHPHTTSGQAQPRTMSAERERVIREHNVSLTGTPRDLRDVLVELEQERILHAAERERHAATLADLRRIEAYMAPHPAEGNMALAVTFGMVRAAIKRAAGERKPEGLAQARGARGAS